MKEIHVCISYASSDVMKMQNGPHLRPLESTFLSLSLFLSFHVAILEVPLPSNTATRVSRGKRRDPEERFRTAWNSGHGSIAVL